MAMFQDNENVPPIISKGRVFGGKVTNNFFLYCTSKKKLLMAFLTKTFSFVARPEFNFRSPRSLKKGHSGSRFFREKGQIRQHFLMQKPSVDKKNRKGEKKIYEVKFSILLHKLASGTLSLSFFSCLKRNQNHANFTLVSLYIWKNYFKASLAFGCTSNSTWNPNN